LGDWLGLLHLQNYQSAVGGCEMALGFLQYQPLTITIHGTCSKRETFKTRNTVYSISVIIRILARGLQEDKPKHAPFLSD
jgi:hypothetical protein